jgi:hypothetical protein
MALSLRRQLERISILDSRIGKRLGSSFGHGYSFHLSTRESKRDADIKATYTSAPSTE